MRRRYGVGPALTTACSCPQSTCAQRFTTLSAVMQHIESDKCGVQRFRVVRDAIAQLTSGMKRLGM